MNASTNHPNCREALRDLMGDALMRGKLDATDELLIAGVLRRAHQAADDLGRPREARLILQVAHSFADELATAIPQFDRLEFIRAATDGGPR